MGGRGEYRRICKGHARTEEADKAEEGRRTEIGPPEENKTNREERESTIGTINVRTTRMRMQTDTEKGGKITKEGAEAGVSIEIEIGVGKTTMIL